MLRLTMEPAELARTRFAISPMAELFGVLSAAARPPAGARAAGRYRAPLRLLHERMPLLAGLVQGRVWLPDFISPTPDRFAPALDDELHQIETLPPARLIQEIALFTTGSGRDGFTGTELSAPIRDQLDRGETAFAQRTARELHALWHHTLAPRWPAIRDRVEIEINARSRVMAEQGTGAALGSVHPDVSWCEGTLSIRSTFSVTLSHAPAVIMIPTVTGGQLTPGLDPLLSHDTMLCYPLSHAPTGRPAEPDSRPVADVLGATRHRLLACLSQPLTTGDLAELHHLDASTVSYHLTRLHRAGLLSRTRHGHRVYYRRTQQAENLLDPRRQQ
ncbi:ArsR/SmtB family transcription factor [Streptomyces sp. CA-111067]|uniref:ArsR/SmtB family transcription factor n=1 Tax=Streptomyces sp. CA-111067 TaxID=3240046 RepID=UPI003D96DAB5